MGDGYEFVKAESSAAVTKPEFAADFQATPGTVSGNTVTGTIDQPNNVYSTQYTNNWNPNNEIVIIKNDEKGAKLAGAQFKLSKKSEKSEDGWTQIATFTSTANAGETLKVGHGLYKLEETKAPNHYAPTETVYFKVETHGNTTTVTLTDEDGKETDETGAAITYADATASGNEVTIKDWPLIAVTLIKTDSTDSEKYLAGAVFALTKKNASGTYESYLFRTSEEGTETSSTVTSVSSASGVTMYDLETGDYCLTETSAPAGYIILSKNIYFTVDAKVGTVILTEGSPENVTIDENTISITIPNNPGTELPNTGGIGNRKFTVAGAMLLMTGLCFGCALRRRERRFDF